MGGFAMRKLLLHRLLAVLAFALPAWACVTNPSLGLDGPLPDGTDSGVEAGQGSAIDASVNVDAAPLPKDAGLGDVGHSWCSTHIDPATLFCNDFDMNPSVLGTVNDTPPGPWSFREIGNGGFFEGRTSDCMPNSSPAALLVQALPTLPLAGWTEAQYGVVRNAPNGVIVTFDLHVDNYSTLTQDISLMKIGLSDSDPRQPSWWVSWDYNVNTGQLAEFGMQTPGGDPAIVATVHTPIPDFTVSRYYHVTFAADFVLYTAWLVLAPAPSTLLPDAGPPDADSSDAADDVVVYPPNSTTNYRTHYAIQYFQGSTVAATFPGANDAGTPVTVVVGLNYATQVRTDTTLIFDNVRVEAVPPEGLPNGPSYPDP
jgi:hypothetical protein